MNEATFRGRSLWVVGWIAALVLLASVPCVVAWASQGEERVFGGIVYNPLDGNSYLAKMREGFNGHWRFELPYTAEPQRGAYILTLYLALGHAARQLHLSLPLTFNLARLLCGAILYATIWWFAGKCIEDKRARRLAFLLASTGAGFGWLAVAAGLFLPDLWVPEGYAFYSVLSNPHFPLGTAFMLGAIGLALVPRGPRDLRALVSVALCALGLSVAQPISVLVLWLVLGVHAAMGLAQRQRQSHLPFLASLAGAAPVTLYDLWSSRADPILAAWSAQNVTLTPAPWEVALAYGLVLVAAVAGAALGRGQPFPARRLLLIWSVVGFAVLYLPVALQRRLIMGLEVPLAVLAARAFGGRWRRWSYAFAGLCSLTSLALIFIGLSGAASGDARLYLSRGEAGALSWLRGHTQTSAVVLASPDLSLFVPAWAGNRVVYGHPFETVEAEHKRQQATAFFANPSDPETARAWLDGQRATLVLRGPREREIGLGPDLEQAGLTQVYASGDVEVWSTEGAP